MLGWFKKLKDSENSSLAASSSPVKASTTIKKITEEEAEFLFDVYFKGNVFASAFYANCAGVKVLTNIDPLLLSEKILHEEPHTFLPDSIRYAANHRLEECVTSLRSEIWELSFQIISTEEYAQRQFQKMGMNKSLLKDPSAITAGLNRSHYKKINDLREKLLSLPLCSSNREYFEDFDIDKLMLSICLRKRSDDFKRITDAIDDKIDILRPIFSRLRNSATNKYGDYNVAPQFDELIEFMSYTFDENDFEFYYSVKPLAKILKYIYSVIDITFSDNIPMDGIDFEHWCAEKIRQQGWETSVSKASGDQGVDVLARRDGILVAIQCKRYANPIGNKAVQEIFTGAQNEDAGHSCVIGTGGFTPSAVRIASKTGVHLLDATNISLFSNLFGFESLEKVEVGEELNHNEYDENSKIALVFNSQGGGLIGTLLRSIVKSSKLKDHSSLNEASDAVFNSLDLKTGYGTIVIDRDSAATLLILAAHSLKALIHLSDESRKILKESSYYDHDLIESLEGEHVVLKNILADGVESDAINFFFDYAEKIGGLLQIEIVNAVNEN